MNEMKENKIKKFLMEHKTGISIGLGIAGAVVCYAVGSKKGYGKGKQFGAGAIEAMLYADHDEAIGLIYDTVEKTLKPEEIKDFVKTGHLLIESVKSSMSK